MFGLSGRALAQHEDAVAPLADALWQPPTEVVQARQVEKRRAIELVALFGVIPNDAFLVYLPLGLRAAYHFSEHWGVELSFEANLSIETGLREYLEENDAELRARIRDRQQLRAGVSAVWSPAYGKLAAGRAVLHFDGYLLGGAGVLRTAEAQEVAQPAAIRPDFHLGAGLRGLFGSRWVVRVELRQYLYVRAKEGGGGLGAATEIALCAGALLGGRRR
jgi:outer membrane beta-barrel protein